MIKRLQKRFILVAMLAVTLVLTVIMGSINIINYRSITKDADAVLAVLEENGGSFDAFIGDMDGPGGQVPGGNAGAPPVFPGGNPPGGGAKPFGSDPRGIFSAETPFESRFFTVSLDTGKNVTATNITRIAAISESEARTLAEEVIASGKTSGFLRAYRFRVSAARSEDSGPTVIFLDCQRSLSNARRFLLSSLLVSVIGLAAVFLLVLLLSRRATRPVAESYEKQKQFITDAGHELKTPLTIINADVSVLETELGRNEWLDDVKTQTGRLAGLTSDLIFLSRMEEGERHLQEIDFPLSDVIAEEVQAFQSRAQVEHKELKSAIAPSLSYKGDEKLIRQLASILLDNALKYSPEGGQIEVSLQQKGREIVFSVCNAAENLDPASMDLLFERFYRGDRSRNSSSGGHGIGLSIAKAIAEAHRGRIFASSEDGHILRIRVTL